MGSNGFADDKTGNGLTEAKNTTSATVHKKERRIFLLLSLCLNMQSPRHDYIIQGMAKQKKLLYSYRKVLSLTKIKKQGRV